MTKTEFIKARLELWKLLLSAFVVAMVSIVLVVLETSWVYFVPSMIGIAAFGLSFLRVGILYKNDMEKLRELRSDE